MTENKKWNFELNYFGCLLFAVVVAISMIILAWGFVIAKDMITG